MKPTMIKTQTTKPLYELSREEHGAAIDIGGVPHNIRRRADGFSLQCPRGDGDDQPGCLTGRASSAALSPDAQVTVTDTREMTTDDLQVGDTWVYPKSCRKGAFNVLVSKSSYAQVRSGRLSSPTVQIDGCRPVTLVDVEFEAEPVDEERTVPVHEAGEFELCGMIGRRVACADSDFAWVEWGVRKGFEYPLPPDTPVAVRKSAAYDSPDDVSVGDVVIHSHTGEPGIAIGGTYGDGCAVLWADTPYGQSQISHIGISHIVPARLTSVTWTPREEVTR